MREIILNLIMFCLCYGLGSYGSSRIPDPSIIPSDIKVDILLVGSFAAASLYYSVMFIRSFIFYFRKKKSSTESGG